MKRLIFFLLLLSLLVVHELTMLSIYSTDRHTIATLQAVNKRLSTTLEEATVSLATASATMEDDLRVITLLQRRCAAIGAE